MDTTYINTMLVVFLVVAALAIDIGYMYVSEEDLRNAAETASLAASQSMKQRIQQQLHADPKGIGAVVQDTVQEAARMAAIESASGKHKAVALMEVINNNTNTLTTANDITVGFWNISTHTYTPGATPANAVQVRTRRTAESESVGLGSVGSILAKISGIEKFNYTPEAISAFPPRANANIAICTDACDAGCAYPDVCSFPERKLVSSPGERNGGAQDRFAYTTLLHQVTSATKLSDLVCMELPPQEVCGREIFTFQETDNGTLRDIASMMYDSNVDKTNKEYDKGTGKLNGWWVIAPVTDCPPARRSDGFERHTVTRYALIRISRICAKGAPGCRQNNTSFKAPAEVCGDEDAVYIDRLSWVPCGSKTMLKFPGLHPVLVK